MEPGQILKNKVFDCIRNPAMEQSAEWKIELKIDEEGTFDYDECKSLKYSVEDMKSMLFEEICIIKSMKAIWKICTGSSTKVQKSIISKLSSWIQ